MSKQKLSKSQLAKRDNCKVLVDKFYTSDMFLTEDGQFIAEEMTITINSTKSNFKKTNKKIELKNKLKDMVITFSKSSDRRASIIFKGKFVGDNAKKSVSLSKMMKTGEFGGQVGGKKVNLGNLFEADFDHSIKLYLNSDKTKKGKYPNEVAKLIQLVGGGVVDSEQVGGANLKRTLFLMGGDVAIKAEKSTSQNGFDIGETVSDITLKCANNKEIYLSLKHGKSVTWMNSGIQRTFKQTDFIKNFDGYSDRLGLAILKMFGIDPKLFAQTFNDYGKSGHKMEHVTVSSSGWQKSKVQNLLKYAIGYNYLMVHGGISGGIKMFAVDEKYMKKSANITDSTIKILYGGKSGKGKRIDIEMQSSKYVFKWNIRNKQGGKYPSHLMCDYSYK